MSFFVPFFHIIGAKDFHCKCILLLVSLRNAVVSNFLLLLTNETSKNDILSVCSTAYINLIFFMKFVQSINDDARNSRVKKLKYEVELRKMTSYLELLTRTFL